MTARATEPGTSMPSLVLHARRVVGQERRRVKEEIERYAQSPQPGCPFLTDRDAWRAARHTQRAHRRRLWQDGMQYARLAVVNVLDHLWAVHQLLNVPDELPLFAHSTVARVAAEGAAKVAHLLDTATDYETRLLRIAVLVRDDAAEHVKAARPARVATGDARCACAGRAGPGRGPRPDHPSGDRGGGR